MDLAPVEAEDMPSHDTADAAVRDSDRVPLKARDPVTDPIGEIFVAFAVAWTPAVGIGLAGSELLRIGSRLTR